MWCLLQNLTKSTDLWPTDLWLHFISGEFSQPPFSTKVQNRQFLFNPFRGIGGEAFYFKFTVMVIGVVLRDVSFMGWGLLFDSSSWTGPALSSPSPCGLENGNSQSLPSSRQKLASEFPLPLWVFAWIFKFWYLRNFSSWFQQASTYLV